MTDMAVNLGVARTVPVPAARSQSRVDMTDKDLATTSSPQAFWIKKSRRALLSLSQVMSPRALIWGRDSHPCSHGRGHKAAKISC